MIIRYSVRWKAPDFFEEDLFLDNSNRKFLAIRTPHNDVLFDYLGTSNASGK